MPPVQLYRQSHWLGFLPGYCCKQECHWPRSERQFKPRPFCLFLPPSVQDPVGWDQKGLLGECPATLMELDVYLDSHSPTRGSVGSEGSSWCGTGIAWGKGDSQWSHASYPSTAVPLCLCEASGCFSLNPGFWNFHSRMLSMDTGFHHWIIPLSNSCCNFTLETNDFNLFYGTFLALFSPTNISWWQELDQFLLYHISNTGSLTK